MKSIYYLLLFLASSVLGDSIDDAIKQRELFEKQKNIFQDKEKQKNEKIIHYDVKKPSLEIDSSSECADIHEIKEEGFSLLSNNEKNKIYNKYLDRCNTLNDIKNLINEMTSLYIDQGFITSKVYIKPQSINNGVLTLYSIEGKIESIKSQTLFTKNSFFYLEDDYLNLRDLEVGIENTNRLSSNDAKLNLVPGTKPGLSIVDIENKSTFPISGYLSYNNFGYVPTGQHQLSFNFNWDNPLGINDQLSIVHNTTDKYNTKNNSENTYYTYSFPIARLLYTLSYTEAEYEQVIKADYNEFDTSGKNKTYNLDLNYKLFHNQNSKVSLGYFVNYYTSRNYFNEALIETSSYNLSKTGVSLNYTYFISGFSMYTTLQHERGVDWFDYNNPTSLEDDFKVFTFDNYISKQFDNFQYSLDFHLQRSSQQLFSVNQISIGGPYSVRGYNEEGLSGNSGYYYRHELSYTANIDILKPFKPTPYIALDSGWIKKEEDTNGGTLVGEAVGLKINYKSLYADMYYSKALKTKNVDTHENFFGVSISYRF